MDKPLILGICGSPFSGGNTEQLLRFALEVAEKEGGIPEFVALAGKNISDCRQCNWCCKKQTENQVCFIEDDADGILKKMISADVVFMASPVYFGRVTGTMANFIDRCRSLVFGAKFKGIMRNKIGGAMAVGWMRNFGLETALMTLYQSLLMLEMIPVSHHHSGVGFGVAGVSTPGGTGKADSSNKLSILSDTYALNGARELGRRSVELARIIKTGILSLSSKE